MKKEDVNGLIWLNYYNDYLYNRGYITENEYHKMIIKIKMEYEKDYVQQ